MSKDTDAWIDYYRRHPGEPLRYPGVAPFLLKLLQHVQLSTTREERTCLEIGAGTGLRNFSLLEELAANVILLDASAESLEAGRTAHPQARRIVGDATDIDLGKATVDVVVACDLFMHLRDWQPCLREVRRVLKPSGVLFFNWLGLEDCQRSRVREADDGFVLPAGVPVVFRDGDWASERVREVGLNVLNLSRDWREDPPHPEFFPEPHIHDEWSMACSR